MSQKADEVRASPDAEDDTRFELDEYNSGDEDPKAKTLSHASTDAGPSSASLQLMEKLSSRTLTILYDTLTDTVP